MYDAAWMDTPSRSEMSLKAGITEDAVKEQMHE